MVLQQEKQREKEEDEENIFLLNKKGNCWNHVLNKQNREKLSLLQTFTTPMKQRLVMLLLKVRSIDC